ncbi:hypothetical protein GCM10023329_26270 [Streptomyces sanyensis]|uniref:Uncharacterized protein n=1 Tax=Streptomyces sanyensis TaxID=568869 RepID=A0ABP9ABP4_9ACTN
MLPADGQEPVIPGPSGAQAAPAGGRPWGAPWGPQQPFEGQAPAGGHGHPSPPGVQAPAYGYPPVPGGPGPEASYGGGPGAGYGGAPVPGAGYGAPSAQVPQGQGYGYPPGPGAQAPAGGHGHPSPPGVQAPGHGYPPVPGGPGPEASYGGGPGAGYGGAPAPGAGYGGAPAPGAGYGAPSAQVPQGQGYGYPPGPGAQTAAPPYGAYGTPAQPLPPQNGPGPHAADPGAAPAAADAEQTRLLPPQGGPAAPAPGGAEDATQYLAPVPPAPPGAGDATQYLAPVPGGAGQPGALPPESPAESTTFLGTKVPARDAASHRAAPAPGGAEDATQYLAPVPPAPSAPPFGIRPGAPGDRQPPAEFDSLFRADAPGGAGADSTRQLPRQDGGPAAPGRPAGPGGGQEPPYGSPPYGAPGRGEGRSGARRSVVPVVAAVVVGCAVLGLGVGAVLFSGGDEGPAPAAAATVAAESPGPPPSEAPEPSDPAEEQAEALDELLADSNDSRSAVIRSVENIKKCTELDQAATDLKDAAEQRRGLVTRLGELTVDELPDHARLTAALTEAWQASASADDHYAAWAKQVKGKRGCKDGQARTTSHTAQGNRASGEATRAKDEASALWNAIAREHGLTERRSTQL